MDSSPRPRTFKSIASLALVVMTGGAVLLFFARQPHVTSDQLHALGVALRSIFVAAGIALAGAGVGRAVRRRWFRAEAPPILTVLTEAGLGLGVLAIVWGGLGLAGWLRPWLAAVLLAGLLGIFLVSTRAWLREASALLKETAPGTAAERALAAFVVLVLGLGLLQALAPPTAWDSLLYHLTGPREAIAYGRAVILEYLPEAGYPQSLESLFTWCLLLGSDRAPALLHWWFGLLAAGIVWGWGRENGSPRTAWLAAALLLGVESFSRQLGRSYVDLAFAFFSAIALGWAVLFRSIGGWRAAALAGLAAGMAMGVKYFGGWVVVAILILLATAKPLRSQVIGIGAAASALAVAPWLLRNLVLSGNPVYPFLFPGSGWDEMRAQWFSQWGSGWLPSGPWQILTAPFSIVLTGSEGAGPWDFTVGPLLLILSVPFLAGLPDRRAAPWVRAAVVYMLVILAAWLAGGAVSRLLAIARLLMPLLLPWSVIAALGWEASAALTLPRFRLQRFLAGVTALMLGWAGIRLVMDTVRAGSAAVVLGVKTETTYLYEQLGWHYAAMEKIESLPPSASVQFLFEPRSYYAPALQTRPDGILDEWFHARQIHESQDAILNDWRLEGVTHVLVYDAGADFLREQGADPLTPADWEAFDRLLEDDLVLVESFGTAYALYELPDA